MQTTSKKPLGQKASEKASSTFSAVDILMRSIAACVGIRAIGCYVKAHAFASSPRESGGPLSISVCA